MSGQPTAPGGPGETRCRARTRAAALTAGFGFYRAFRQDARDNLAAADAATGTPVLYVRGAASRGNIDSYAHGLRAAGVRHLTARLVPDAGHFVPDEQPEQLWRHIREFITTGSASPGRTSATD